MAAVGLVGVTVAPVNAAQGSQIKVHLGDPGLHFKDWGFDIKQANNDGVPIVARRLAQDPDYAREIFGNKKITVLRIPIRANWQGVRPDGLVRRDYYTDIINAANNALAVNKDLKIFASRSTISVDGSVAPYDYANSLKLDETNPESMVVMWKYARMLDDYLTFMRENLKDKDGNSIAVSVLGIENEPGNNEGNIAWNDDGTANIKRFKDLIGFLDGYHTEPLPDLVMADAANADYRFLEKAANAPYTDGDAWSVMTYAGTHYRSDRRAGMRDDLKTHAAIARTDHPAARQARIAWDTEYHWIDHDQNGTTPETYNDAVNGVLGSFDHTDLGYTGVVWWGFRPCRDTAGAHRCEQGPKAGIQSALVDSMGNSWRLPTDDSDGTTTTRGQLITRSFRSGQDVYMWVVNDRNSAAWSQVIHIPNVSQTSSPKFERWTRGENGNLSKMKSGQGMLSGGDGVLSFPARSITLVRLANVA